MKFEEKIRRADELRKKNNKATRDLENLSTQWINAYNKAKTKDERDKIDNKFGKKYRELDKMEDKAYARYSHFVDLNFDRETVMRISAGGIFPKKEFINKLRKEEQRRLKK